MAVVKGVKEQVHLPLYDCVEVKPGKQLGGILTSNLLRFFVDVTGKTKLLTNMQAASLLPHWNTFEARALRVVISDLCPRFPDDLTAQRDFLLKANGRTGRLTVSVRTLVALKREVERSTALQVNLKEQADLDDRDLKLTVDEGTTPSDFPKDTLGKQEEIIIDRVVLKDIESKFQQNGQALPPAPQIFPNNGCGTVISNFIYNTVTTFFVGEKIMIQVPTWFFPAGAGPYSEDGGSVTHGYPNPQATFRFAEPVLIETQQNFRVEIEIPESDVLKELQRLYGPLFIWVVLDGYMTRDVQ